MAVASPFVSALLAAFLTYQSTLKTKKFDILYANKIPAFKEVMSSLTAFKIFCEGRVAYFQGNEFSPYYQEGVGGLAHRTEITTTIDLNSVFISDSSKAKINELLGKLSLLCTAELSLVSGQEIPGIETLYKDLGTLAKDCIAELYNELNLSK